MPKYGLLTNPGLKVPDEIRRFAKLGFDYAEINFEEPYGLPQTMKKDRKTILALLEKNKMFAVGHSAYWVDFGSLHEKVRRGWIEEAKDMIDAAAGLKIKYLNFHFWGGTGQTKKIPEGRKLFLANFAKSMKELTEYGKKKGVTIMLENMTPYNPKSAYMLKDFEYVVKNAPLLMVHLDVAHAFVEGGNKKIDEYITKFPKKIVHIHVHDNNGEEDEHLAIGEGRINFKKVVSSLKKIKYDGTITFEVFKSGEEGELKSRDKFKKLWGKN